MRDLIIAIDGFSSTGKSTLAKLLARELGYVHIDSGAMYRAITLFAVENNLFEGDLVRENELVSQLELLDIHFELNAENGKNEIYLNGENVEEKIREMEISSKVSIIAKIPEVREFAVQMQRKLGEKRGIVMDGRDIGTTVFPKADLKIYLNASAEARALRRYEELLKTDHPATYEGVFQNISERDLMDSTREVSPLRKAADAVEVDNGQMTPTQTLETVLQIIRERFKS